MANPGPNLNASQFYITVGENMSSLDDQHTVFGIVSEGLETVMKINDAFTDQDGRPLQVIRIRHTLILDDPFPDPSGISVPSRSPSPKPEKHMLAEDFDIKDIPQDEETLTKMKEELAAKEARAREEILAVVDDLPDADVKPPDNVLFVCKLNPVTTSEDLEIIFSRFGNIISCEVIRDWKTKESLQYAFIEFEKPEQCEEAYFKMNDVLVDDRRIHVDFSQSVAKEKFKAAGGWKGYFSQKAAEMSGRGPKYESKNRGNNSKYDMLFEDDEDRRRSKRKRDDDSDSGSGRKRYKRDDKRRDNKRRSRSRSKERRRSRTPPRDNKRRSRSRSRDQKRNRDRDRRSRSRSRDRRSRSKSRDRKRR
jgi:peptidyl-prolyl cis-trans isomerase-like 4